MTTVSDQRSAQPSIGFARSELCLGAPLTALDRLCLVRTAGAPLPAREASRLEKEVQDSFSNRCDIMSTTTPLLPFVAVNDFGGLYVQN